MRATAVVGMNYGDEGKGHIVNYLSDVNTLVVRTNGGAQASHAVFLADGRNHIFHHFGSGSLRGARTLLASHFIINPMIFSWETWDLTEKTPMREIFIDPRCRVTTPYDMVVNEFHAKNKGKFDTVGVGINETVERSMYRQLSINMRDFSEKSDDEITQTLKKIEHEYLPFRIEKLGLPKDEFWKFYNDIVKKDSMIESFLKIRQWMNDKLIVVWPDDSVIDKFLAKDPKRKVVFEAGQGLLLDQHRKEFFPYLTRSSTGMTNILELLQTVRSRLDLQVLLVTRTYLTRHGDGPIWNHVPNTYPFPKIEEPTNPDHTFQGKMRYGHLSMAWYKKAIEETKTLIDKHRPECLLSTFTEVAMTCLDQVGDEFSYSLDGGGDITKGEVRDFPKIKLLSSGHTEKDIKPV
jgi:adenylosuccinate synthase